MNHKERTAAAMNFRQPDRVPRYWQNFWDQFEDNWTSRYGRTDLFDHLGDDMKLVIADESPWPSQAGTIKTDGEWVVVRTAWGEVKRTVMDQSGRQQVMGQLLEAPVPQRVDPATLEFEDPLDDSRYEAAGARAAELKDTYYTMCKTGGPYLRAAFLRSETEFWMDVAEDPEWTRAFVERVVDHIIVVGLESLRRFDLYETGIAIYDDVSASWGPFVGPDHYEKIFLPSLRRMVKAYKDAGARKVMHHSDGNNLPLLEMWVDAGVDAINPVEFRSGMDPVKIKEQFGDKLVCVGGLDNCAILPRGDKAEIKDHIDHLLSAGSGGGYILGPHSIGPDITPETMEYIRELLDNQAPAT